MYKFGGYFDTGRFVDQMLQHFGRVTELDAFVRGNWTADTDRNQIVYAVDGGFALQGPFGRAGDVPGLGAACA